MQDFLTFQTFITPTLLLVMYYVGALLVPLVSYIIARWITSVYFSNVSTQMKKSIVAQTTTKQRLVLFFIFLFCFVCMEVFWRVLFEFFIAYFDMHDALIQLTKV